MITIKNTSFTSNVSLSAIMNCTTKVNMLKICKSLDLYVSPNLKKDETARRLANEILENINYVLCSLCKNELELVEEFVKAGPNAYVERKMRKTFYKLQKFNLVLTYEDEVNDKWVMLMPDCVREAFAETYQPFLKRAQKGMERLTPRDLRFMGVVKELGLR